MANRLDDLVEFYDLLERLEQKLDGKRKLSECSGRMNWPTRGVYFFFEQDEERHGSGRGPRVVRVGTHALTSKSRTTLWNRLSQHRGVEKTGGGNHRGSIFRLIVGSAQKKLKGQVEPRSWGVGSDVGQAAAKLDIDREKIRAAEFELERQVTRHIGSMPFLWLAIGDAPGPKSLRGIIERNSIALLSNFEREPIDPPSQKWLGHNSDRERVRRSGLWNNNHVDEEYGPNFLGILRHLIDDVTAP